MRPHFLLPALLLPTLVSTPIVATEDDTQDSMTLAIRTADAELKAALADGPFQRFVLPNAEGLRLEVGPKARGDVVIEACRLSEENAPELADRLDGLPAAMRGDALVLGDVSYHDRDLALALRLPRAEKRHWVVCGFEAQPTAGVVDRVLFQEAELGFRRGRREVDYLLHEHDYSERSGRWRLTEDGVRLDPEERDDPTRRSDTYGTMLRLPRERLTLRVPPAAAKDPRAPALADRLDRAVAELTGRLGAAAGKDDKIEILVEDDHATQGRHTGQIGAAVLRRDRLHLVYHPDDFDFYRYELARLLVRRAELSSHLPSPMLEDGAALWLAQRWYGRPYRDWLADLAFGEVLPSRDELMARRRPGDGSQVLWPPVAAAVIDRLPGTTLAEKLRSDRLDATLGSALEALRSTDPAGPTRSISEASVDTEAKAKIKASKAVPFQRGLSFAMANGLDIGYHAPGVDAQLDRLKDMGADAVSLMPFAYQSRPQRPELRFLNRSPSSETDVGVIHAARRADDRGFHVLWKPHIWVSFESWPGDIGMENDADWRAWWTSYRRFILHHAILARFAGAEMLSLGVELGRTVTKEREWRHLIAAARRVFPGQLTYAGNWWDDYEKVRFWDALDVVGIDAYFPLASSDDADDLALREGARRMAAKLEEEARRFARPILLTEVGFAARRGAWVSPHEEGGEMSDEHQRRAWAALLAELGKPDWLRGLYAWKVFSHPRVEHTSRPDFRFLNRPAAAELERWFKAD